MFNKLLSIFFEEDCLAYYGEEQEESDYAASPLFPNQDVKRKIMSSLHDLKSA